MNKSTKFLKETHTKNSWKKLFDCLNWPIRVKHSTIKPRNKQKYHQIAECLSDLLFWRCALSHIITPLNIVIQDLSFTITRGIWRQDGGLFSHTVVALPNSVLDGISVCCHAFTDLSRLHASAALRTQLPTTAGCSSVWVWILPLVFSWVGHPAFRCVCVRGM